MKAIREGKILYAVIFFAIILILGLKADINMYKYKVKGTTEANYEYSSGGTGGFATEYSVNFPYKTSFVDLNGLGRRIAGQREMNQILKLNNGHLVSQQSKMSDDEIRSRADEVIKYAEFCKNQGKPLLFVQPILKVDKNNKQLPIGVDDYSNENIDSFLEYLRQAGIEVLDIRQCMESDGMDLYDYTYVTDHHWTTEGCFYAFTKITNWINQETEIEVDPSVIDLDHYKITTYSNWHLGSYGQRTGQYFAGIDDYNLITPDFSVSFIDGENNEHSFYEQVVNQSVFEMRDPTSRYTYDHATRCPSGIATTSRNLSVLFVTDSYATAMAPYIKLAYSNYYHQYYPNGLNADYVIQSNPDVVILMPFNTNTFNKGAVYIPPTNK